jgi:hypothetical protein
MKEITRTNAEMIMGPGLVHFFQIERNVYCSYCEGSVGGKVTEIVEYKIFLHSSFDIVLKGRCKKCGKPVARLIETGEDPGSIGRAKKITG